MVVYIKSDLEFILKQIKISEAHALYLQTNGAQGAPLFGPSLNANPASIPSYNIAWGLRTVDGSYNHLLPGQEQWGAADREFPELMTPEYRTIIVDPDGDGPSPAIPITYTPGNDVDGPGTFANPGDVIDPSIRTISNLIVDQTLGNPSAILTALQNAGVDDPGLVITGQISDAYAPLRPLFIDVAEAARAQASAAAAAAANPDNVDLQAALVTANANLAAAQSTLDAAADVPGGLTDLLAANGITLDGANLHIPNTAPDEGLSAPFNSWFTLFGQFFDHGLDLVNKGGNGTVMIPLQPDDPLFVTPTAENPNPPNFMVLTRATTSPGADGVLGDNPATPQDESLDDGRPVNTTTSFVDQNQTYASHPSHQLFLRQYVSTPNGPVATGNLIEGANGGMANWAELKTQAATILGIELTDQDVAAVPLMRTDPYGNFIPGPNGYPQLIIGIGLDGVPNTSDDVVIEGNPADPVDPHNVFGTAEPEVPVRSVFTNHAFLADIAHGATPDGLADGDTEIGGNIPVDGVYDDELLDAHFIAGDGRANENIGLTAVHHVFHSEHNRLADSETVPGSIKNVLVNEDPTMVSEWKLPDGSWNGERIFQAAKFVTEMEYQHLVFEEFARKVQPMINAFGEGGTGYNTSIDPAIKAEFAHAVYRFGHSMLTETVARRNAGGGGNNTPLLDAFLHPQAFTDGGPAGQLNADAAAGSIFRGMSRQVGNEIDEFVTPALRSNLLGLPLDLAAINMARARETGVPSLNAARRVFYAESNNSQVKPYESWADFSFSLRHPESLVNFVAAYGTHSSITGAASVAAKRDAASAIVYGAEGPDGVLADIATTPEDESADNPTAPVPDDGLDFLNSTEGTPWANNANGVTVTGLDQVDLWMGGLAEKQMVFGGLLGSTFNYVFELQMEDLQFGDRFYYLSRTAGLNLLTQLEGNSFAEMVMRNTDVEGLPADAFSRPDYIFNMSQLGASGPIPDDASTEEVESDRGSEPGMHLNRTGAHLRYTGPAHSVFNGTAGADRMWASEGDDTIRGNDGDDWMQGGDGVDSLIGGLGDDIMNDLFGDDTLKGGDGNDALSSGQGFAGDLNQGGRGKDFIVDGNDLTEAFAGPGDDFVLGGDDIDTVFGDDGNDWVEGGAGPFNLLQGDNGNPFQDDPNGGHDVLDGDGGEQDFDSEGGDDVMRLGPGIQRAEGMLGFDWITHQGDPQAGDSDMLFTGLLPPTVGTLRDRFDLVEGMSGWTQDDVLRGDSGIPAELEGTFTPEGQRLTQAGIDRINGLAELLPAGTTSFTDGNIIVGGGGGDTMEGRGGDDVIDGDAWLEAKLRIPDLSTPGETMLVDGMKSTALVEGGVNRSLEQLVFAGRINPGDISIVRRMRPGSPGSDTDTAVFSDIRVNYDCQVDDGPSEPCTAMTDAEMAAGATTTITHVTVPPDEDPEEDEPDDGVRNDGIDTLTNVENLVFADTLPPGAPGRPTATAGNSSATVTWQAPIIRPVAITDYFIQVVRAADGAEVGGPRRVAGNLRTTVINNLNNGTAYQFKVRARNAAGDGPFSALSAPVTPGATVPGAPTISAVEPGHQRVTVNWADADDGGGDITRYQVRVTNAAGGQIGDLRNASATANRLTVTGLRNGTTYWFQVRATNNLGNGPFSAESPGTPGGLPSAPRIGTAAARDTAALVTWRAPLNNGGLGINDYRIRVVNPAGNQVGALRTVNATATSARVGQLVNGRAYRFQVIAINEMGSSTFSAMSNRVVPGTRPNAPVIRRATSGPGGGSLTATARWAAPRAVTLPRLTGYTVVAMRMQSRATNATVLRRFRSGVLRPARTQRKFVLPDGIYRFQVVAWNSIGRSQPSAPSRPVRAR
jgi:Ca2+-binding RTX toxin-like protein